MGICFQFLTILAGIFFLQSVIALAGGSGCLKCHEPHYEEKGACVDCHRGNPGTDRISIAHHNLILARYADFTMERSPVVKRGGKLIETFGCRRCHVTGAKGNRLAANLDRVLVAARPQKLFDAIKTPALFMPDFCFKETHIIELVNAILAQAARTEPEAGEIPLVIHFEDEEQDEENVFVKHCSSCHTALTARFGGLGKGNIGPNLSGLFSEYYPKTYGNKDQWSSERLKKWLKNPREVRKNAQMAPVKLTSDEFSRLLKALGGQIFTRNTKKQESITPFLDLPARASLPAMLRNARQAGQWQAGRVEDPPKSARVLWRSGMTLSLI